MNGGPGSGSKPARCSSQGRTGLLPPKSVARVEVPIRLSDVPARLSDVPTRLSDVPTRLSDVPIRLSDVPTRPAGGHSRRRETMKMSSGLSSGTGKINVEWALEFFPL